MFSFMRNWPTVFRDGYIILHFHQWGISDLVFPHASTSIILDNVTIVYCHHSDLLSSDTSLCFKYAFPCWFIMLNIISCTYFPSAYIFIEKSVSFAYFLIWVFVLLCYWVLSVLYIFRIPVLCWICGLQIFPHSLLLIFHLLQPGLSQRKIF